MVTIFSIVENLTSLKVKYGRTASLVILLSTIVDKIKSRSRKFFEFEIDDAEVRSVMLAAGTHPSIKMSIFSGNNERIVKEELIKEAHSFTNEMSNTPLAASDSCNHFVRKTSAFLCNKVDTNRIAEFSVEAEISSYLGDYRQDIRMLDTYPVLKKIFFKYNTILSTSAPSERLFSIGPLTCTNRRNNLTPNMLGILMFLKGNM